MTRPVPAPLQRISVRAIQFPTRSLPTSRIGFWALLLALSLHFFLIVLAPTLWPNGIRWLTGPHSAPQRTPVDTIDAGRLEKIRNRVRQEKLLLSKESQPQLDSEDARFADIKTLSNRNQRVQQETRAKDANSTLPQPRTGRGGPLSGLAVPIPGLNQKSKPGRSASVGARSQTARNSESPARTQPGGSPGSEQLILDDELAAGAENILSTRASRYYSFYARIHQAIGPLWESQARQVTRTQTLAPADYITQVEIELDREGHLIQVRIHRSAGVEAFDRAVVESWKKVGRFPNPPDQLLEQNGRLKMGWTFTFRLQKGGLEVLTPQRRF